MDNNKLVDETDTKVDKNKITLKIVEPIQEEWTVYEISKRAVPDTWEKVFENAEHELKDVSGILEQRKELYGKFYPENKNIFRAFELTRLNKVKVVIFGQDPYHSTNRDGQPVAQGLSFSVSRTMPVPPSLKNMYIELKNCIPEFNVPNHGDLTGWARQGVLMCNSCLTVDPGMAGSHKELWLGFIKSVIDGILEVNKNCIFVLWGRKAQKINGILKGRGKTLEGAHPSPFSAKRGFFGCEHFKIINEMLIKQNKYPINWNLP